MSDLDFRWNIFTFSDLLALPAIHYSNLWSPLQFGLEGGLLCGAAEEEQREPLAAQGSQQGTQAVQRGRGHAHSGRSPAQNQFER